ncbi:HhH-GPD family protein [Pelobacter propionicus]|uniref:Adenine DNA glycosylase n=1 Tax=Pelobacter propionicus (strain DSM 2379 / NBRC 103807 / OttBd1) TaxID=338966 RepID=A1AUQ8_PELPD|nr:endonuclease III [Pelobacter propionicus]ABL01079.1 HhH-GPD family protein [Pelobacter propionicus DSM 2379]
MLSPQRLTEQYHAAGELDAATVTAFRRAIYRHFHANPRPMPWRETSDPYHILVSEVMLQQTQVERVKAKYAQFLETFPTVRHLATAPLEELLRLWQGLGYNRRAIALKRCAEQIHILHEGNFPTTIHELQNLPGIGPYTARAVAAFAFGLPEPFIETNIRTVFIHFFFHKQEGISDRQLMPLVGATLDHSDPRHWYYALMDYGVRLKQLYPNPGRRSSHHVRQSPFKGSNRELRSRMLRAVMECPGILPDELAKVLEAERGAVEKNLQALAREGFVEQRGDGFGIRTCTSPGAPDTPRR